MPKGASRTRIRLTRRRVSPWRPKWEPEIRGWAFNYIRQNKWRYEHIHDIEDLMQDAHLVFLKVAEAYPRVVEPRHFMSLYKTSLRNALADKAREYHRKLDLIDEGVAFDPLSPEGFTETGYEVPEGPLAAMISHGPPELKMFLDLLQDDNRLAELRKPQREKRGEPRLNFDQRISKLLGIDCFPFRESLRQLLTS